MIFDFPGIPATADAKEKALDRSNQLCCLNGIALHDEAHARAELERLRNGRRGAEYDERSMTSE